MINFNCHKATLHVLCITTSNKFKIKELNKRNPIPLLLPSHSVLEENNYLVTVFILIKLEMENFKPKVKQTKKQQKNMFVTRNHFYNAKIRIKS